jgi:anti-anti-sigma regulatory factor
MAALRLPVPDRRTPVLIAVVSPHGANGPEAPQSVCDDLDRAIDAGATMVIVDLDTATSIGTRSLNALLRARCRVLARGGRVAMVVSPRLRRLFGLLGLDRRFLLASSRRQAIELLGLSDGFTGRRSPASRARAA